MNLTCAAAAAAAAAADDDDKGIPAERNENQYDCCPEVYIDITFTVRIRRRKLYYIFNLVVPCFMMSCLSLRQSFVLHYRPGDCPRSCLRSDLTVHRAVGDFTF